MTVANQLYQLQEVDLAIEANEQAQTQIASQLGQSKAVVKAQTELALEQQRLEDLGNQQRSAEWEIDDLVAKLAIAQGKLYGGEIKNPKELASLQHEVDALKSRRSELEDKALAIMEQVDITTANVASRRSEIETLEAEWRSQQQQLSAEMEQLKTVLIELNHKRQLLLTKIDPQAVEVYNELRKQKGTAVAKVEQGVCRGCRISLPVTDLQQARSENLVRCSSCGRILFLA